MVNVVSKLCHCKTAHPNFGFEGGKPTHCSKCRTSDMVDVKSPKCHCKKSQPTFGVEGGRPTHCSSCMTSNMVDVVSKKCHCKAGQPSFGVEGGRPTHCSRCRTGDMVALRCKKCFCEKGSPTFGVEGGRPTHCSSCRTSDMVDVVHEKCHCKRGRPTFGVEGGRPTHCSSCRTSDLVDVVNPKCHCRTGQPTFGVEGGRPTHCSSCRTSDMVDVLHPKCHNGCGTIADRRYKGYCLRCYVYLFPGEKVARNYKVKEQHFIDYTRPAGVLPATAEVTFERRLQGGCSARKPDIFVDVFTHTVHAENDEHQHSSSGYSCENKRLMELFRDAGNRPQIQLRFNPDGYTSADGQKHPSCFKYNKLGVPVIRDRVMWEACMGAYIERLVYHLTHVPDREVTVEHMFYNGFDCGQVGQ